MHTNNPISGAFRGFGVPQAAIWQETLYNQIADKAGLDRLEFRLLNTLRNGETSATGQVMQAAGIADCLSALRPHWQDALTWARNAKGAESGSRHADTAAAIRACQTPPQSGWGSRHKGA